MIAAGLISLIACAALKVWLEFTGNTDLALEQQLLVATVSGGCILVLGVSEWYLSVSR